MVLGNDEQTLRPSRTFLVNQASFLSDRGGIKPHCVQSMKQEEKNLCLKLIDAWWHWWYISGIGKIFRQIILVTKEILLCESEIWCKWSWNQLTIDKFWRNFVKSFKREIKLSKRNQGGLKYNHDFSSKAKISWNQHFH